MAVKCNPQIQQARRFVLNNPYSVSTAVSDAPFVDALTCVLISFAHPVPMWFVFCRRDRHNILRPETLESLYYLYWITREEIYRDQAWAIFEAFEEHCRVDRGGYAGLEDVTDVRDLPPSRLVDAQTRFRVKGNGV